MKLIELLTNKDAVKDVIVGYYGESAEKLSAKSKSDLSIFAFTEEGQECFRDVLECEIKQITADQEILLLAEDEDLQALIDKFWTIFTRFGAYRWNTDYEYSDNPEKHSVLEMIEHRRYFTFTSEMQLNS